MLRKYKDKAHERKKEMKNRFRSASSCGLYLLAAVTVLAAVSCGSASETSVQDTDPIVETAAESVTEAVSELTFLPDADFGGETFTFITCDANDSPTTEWWVNKDIYAEATNGDVINDAVYDRNTWVEQKYNVKIAQFPCVTATVIRSSVQAGVTDYDAAATSISNGCTLGVEGLLYDMTQVPVIDLNAAWWDQGLTEGISLAGKCYISTGDIMVIDNDATWTLMFNKKMAADLDFNFYEMVRENQWDMDTFLTCAKAAVKDANGDGTIKGADDIWGFATSGDSSRGLLAAGNVMLAAKNAEGMPVLSNDLSRLEQVITKAGSIMSEKSMTILTGQTGAATYEDLQHLFESGNALFYGEVMQCVTRMRNSELDFGVIPYPKYDLSQENYSHYVHKSAGKGICIPVTQSDLEMAGTVIEAMAAKSVDTLTEAYYDKALTYKYMRDEDSVEMLQIILKSRTYDLAYIYGWGNISDNMCTLIAGGKTNVASTWEKKVAGAEKAIAKTVDTLLNSD